MSEGPGGLRDRAALISGNVMAESEAASRVETCPGGEGGAGTRTVIGGSLPPRKRLLAGLKKNGSWLSASSQTSSSRPTGVHDPEVGMVGEPTVDESVSTISVLGEAKGNCVSCGALHSGAWRRVKRNGVVQRLCNSCAVLSSPNMSCPHCQAACLEVADQAVWMQCHQCKRVVHLECEKSTTLMPYADGGSYVCADCVEGKMRDGVGSDFLGINAQRCSQVVGLGCTQPENCTSAAAIDCPSPGSKKSRVSKEPRSKLSEARVKGNMERLYQETEPRLERKGLFPHGAGVAAAEAAAALAVRTAASARATAAAKAVAAVRAAAAAKIALDAAASAARAEAHVRGELPRGSFYYERSAIEISQHDDAHVSETRKNRMTKSGVKAEDEEIPGATISSIDDEELARQLHRVINSSPRISRGLTPLRRKPAGQLGAVSSASDSVRVWPRSGLSPATEPRSQLKQQQTRPRSVCHKDAKRLEFRSAKHESKTAPGDSCPIPSQQPASITASHGAEQNVALRSEPTESQTVDVVKRDSEPHFQDARTLYSAVIIKDEPGHSPGTVVQDSLSAEGNQRVLISAAGTFQAGIVFDEVSEEVNVQGLMQKGQPPRMRSEMSTRGKEKFPSPCVITVSDADAQKIQEICPPTSRRCDVEHTCSGVPTLSDFASGVMGRVEFSEAKARGTKEKGECEEGSGSRLEVDSDTNNNGQILGKGNKLSREECIVRKADGCSELKVTGSESPSHSVIHDKLWQRDTLVGIPGFGDGGCVSFSSNSPMPVASLALASRSANRHS